MKSDPFIYFIEYLPLNLLGVWNLFDFKSFWQRKYLKICNRATVWNFTEVSVVKWTENSVMALIL